MIANLFTVADLAPARLRDALADVLAVPEEAVDVADTDDDQENRNWEARALCTYTRLPPGDLSLALDISTDDNASVPLTEHALARALAAAAATPVLFPSDIDLPSAYWVVTPDGRAVRCRLEAIDTEEAEPSAYRVDATEQPVPHFPLASVGPLPEILDRHPLATPVTDAFTSTRVTGPAASIEGRLHYALRLWERLIRRLEANDWAPSGRYRQDLYRRDLEARDDLARLTPELDRASAEALRAALSSLDAGFRAHTDPDEAAEPGPGDRWWWRRSPAQAPW
ncbi:hypothetical protein N4P33_03405 [Streptomyces sp. 15-116A]|uniref:hypothetical protein n=1 Tax=Streptomyces sp. 15-116A TaxID=2259035 RepID=UPI0021B4CD41|nr:hypothetical protein [Streptomyces sp. 15-116A]MCT7351217.1 hypothetical protein [Streptomyces sp. 15-116A]